MIRPSGTEPLLRIMVETADPAEAQSLAEQIDALKAAARECGPLPDEPFIQMAFLSLPVIPALKLTSQGLFDGEKFAFTTLEVTE